MQTLKFIFYLELSAGSKVYKVIGMQNLFKFWIIIIIFCPLFVQPQFQKKVGWCARQTEYNYF